MTWSAPARPVHSRRPGVGGATKRSPLASTPVLTATTLPAAGSNTLILIHASSVAVMTTGPAGAGAGPAGIPARAGGVPLVVPVVVALVVSAGAGVTTAGVTTAGVTTAGAGGGGATRGGVFVTAPRLAGSAGSGGSNTPALHAATSATTPTSAAMLAVTTPRGGRRRSSSGGERLRHRHRRALARLGPEARRRHVGVDPDAAGERLDEADRVRERGQVIVVVGLDRGEVADGNARVAGDVDQLDAAGGARRAEDRADPAGVARGNLVAVQLASPRSTSAANSRGPRAKSMRLAAAAARVAALVAAQRIA